MRSTSETNEPEYPISVPSWTWVQPLAVRCARSSVPNRAHPLDSASSTTAAPLSPGFRTCTNGCAITERCRCQCDREDAAVRTAAALRRRCICQEDPGNGPCGCALPVTREQVGRLRAYAAQHPERAIIFSELTGQWMSALPGSFAPGEDGVLAWLRDPGALPPAAGLRSAADLGTLLDTLGAPPAAAMS